MRHAGRPDLYCDCPYPAVVLVAGVLWLVLGTPPLLGFVYASLVLTESIARLVWDDSFLPALAVGLLGVALGRAGMRCLSGTAADTRTYAVGSLFLGFFAMALVMPSAHEIADVTFGVGDLLLVGAILGLFL